MKASKVLRWASLALCFSALAAIGFGEPPQVKNQFEPQVGQAGKDVVWVPTPQALVEKMLDMAKVTPQDFVMDLGSGDGRTVITAAKRGARAMGIEYNPDMVELSRRNAAAAKVTDKATFLGLVSSGTLTHDVMESDDFHVRVYGDTAVVTSRGVSGGTYQGRPFRELERVTCVFVRQRGQWTCVVTHLSRISQTADQSPNGGSAAP